MGKINIKFCGLKNQKEVNLCNKLGVAYIGFVFAEKSARFISLKKFSSLNLQNSTNVAVFLNPTIKLVKEALFANKVDFIQIHGKHTESVLKHFYGKVGIIKAFSGTNFTQEELRKYEFCDFLLFDGNAPGSGKERDFTFAKQIKTSVPFFLSGGINASNYQNALKYTNYIDLSSGIEDVRGVKSLKKMEEFMQEACQNCN